MLIRLMLFIFAMMPFTGHVDAGFWDQIKNPFWKPAQAMPPMIKVLIVHDEPGVVIEVKGKYNLFDPNTREHISTRFVGKRKFIQALKDGLRWGEEFPGVFQLLIAPEDFSSTTIVDGIEYQGAIYIYDIGGSISVVNEINIEDYLKSILARQYLEPLKEETLAALAITARTNAYAQALNPKTEYWAVDGRKMGYLGHAVTNSNTGIERAIRATKYLILSKSGMNSGAITPFLGAWGDVKTLPDAQASKITIKDADEMAIKGSHAAQILSKAFPDSSIVLMYKPGD